jgi:hypothetical protein
VLGVHDQVYRGACAKPDRQRYIGPMAALATPTPLEAIVEETVKSFTPPKGIRLHRVYFDEDHTGDPAIRVIFVVTRKIELTKQRVQELSDFRLAVADALWKLQTERIPYVRYGVAR